jgi:iron uptake system component EfeO
MRSLTTPLVLAAMLLAACTSNHAPDTITVRSTDHTCEVAPDRAPGGHLVFDVTNAGTEVTEFYLLAEDGVQIIGEVENIGPGLTRSLVVEADPGSYVAACKPGMTGDGIRTIFTVGDSG